MECINYYSCSLGKTYSLCQASYYRTLVPSGDRTWNYTYLNRLTVPESPYFLLASFYYCQSELLLASY